jgi:DNA repair protein RadC
MDSSSTSDLFTTAPAPRDLGEASAPGFEPESLRARVDRLGLANLNEQETLALFISRTAPRGGDAFARSLLRRFGDLQHVLGAPRAELEQLVPAEIALDLKLLHDTARRLLAFPMVRRSVISSWTALLAYLRAVMAAEPRELFRVLFLDKRNCLIADEVMGVGTVDHAPVYPREIVRRALELNASAVILCHQHPGLDPTPSSADVDMTRKVVDAARALGIAVHDHVVVGGDATTSMKALGLF